VKIDIEIAFSFKHELDGNYRCLELPTQATVLDAFNVLASRYVAFRERVFDTTGDVRRNINALINGENVQYREGFRTVLVEGDRLSVLPPVGGG